MLLKFLDFQADASDADQTLPLLNGMGFLSLQNCLDACKDVISLAKTVVNEISNEENLLGAWWLTTYYSK